MNRGVLGIGAAVPPQVGTEGRAEDLIARLEPRHVPAYRLDVPCQIGTGNKVLRFAQPGPHDPEDVGHAPHRVPDICMEGGRANPDQHLIVPDTRLIDLAHLQHVGRAIPVLDDRLHRVHSPLFAKRSNRQSLQAARALEKTSRRRACRSLNPPTATLKSIMER